MNIFRPVFFIGVPRSGTTIIFESFSLHDKFCWLSNYFYHFPVVPQVGLFQRLFFGLKGEKNQGQGVPFYNRILPKTAEVYKVWETFFGEEFSYNFLIDKAPDKNQAHRCRQFIDSFKKYAGKEQFTAKFTGPPRIHFLKKVFPECIFVNIIRDPRAVIASLFKVDFWIKRDGFKKPLWSNGLTKEDYETWEHFNKSESALAALQLRKIIQLSNQEAINTRSEILDIRYEDFINNPDTTIRIINTFANLKDSKRVVDYIKKQNYVNMNYKYASILSKNDIKTVESICSKEMMTYRYVKTN